MAIAVDKMVQRKGISLASKCCYSHQDPNLESPIRLFLNGEIASYIWNFFATALSIEGHALTISHMLHIWMMKISSKTLYGWLCNMIPPLIFLECIEG